VFTLLPQTARQYGEVVLPDASTGQGPGTLAEKLSRSTIIIEGRCAFPGATAITNLSWKQEQKQKVWQLVPQGGKQLTHIVRVLRRCVIVHLGSAILLFLVD